MKVIKQARAPLAAVILLGIATVLILLAFDVRSWQRTLGRDDARFAAVPSDAKLWGSPGILPGDPAGALLGVADPVAYRSASQGFWASAVGTEQAKASSSDLSAARVATQEQLQSLAANARTGAERSNAANMLGVLTVTTTAVNHATLLQILARATAYFQTAIRDDPANWPAKANLELVLRATKPGKSRFNADARGGFGSGGSYGVGVVGGGF